ncbi:hypothetical protein, conserved [Plasmodium gonderi]|uniref:Secreted ookinete protein 25 n=1 Tax=Plasmodium gonderi TaxID=77519 RepID=A0A1Y1JKV7_PLAGO|nr:hypothetical protein, conserved [Plasmodium gonderi]GAW81827.1 hypothetical protein, conserved [Plasmodium gonderi]
MAKTCYFPFLFLTYFFLNSVLLARSDHGYVYNEQISKYVKQNSSIEQQQYLQHKKGKNDISATLNNNNLSKNEVTLSLEELEEEEKKRDIHHGTSHKEDESRLKREAGESAIPSELLQEEGKRMANAVLDDPSNKDIKEDSDNADNVSSPTVVLSMLQEQSSNVTLNNKMSALVNLYSTQPPKFTLYMQELFQLYNTYINIKNDNFSFGSISLHFRFHKYENEDDVASLSTVFYATKQKDETHSNVEEAKGDLTIHYNVQSLLEKKDLGKTAAITPIQSKIIRNDNDSSIPTYVCQAIYESNIDTTKHFITLDKVSEDEFSVSKLDDFLGKCLKGAQEEILAKGDKKRETNGNLQSGNAKVAKTSGKVNDSKKKKKTRKDYLNQFNESIVKKDIAACKDAAKLLMANSVASSLMYIFVVIALGISLF